ncbi:MAG: DNA polymerase III subunit gamma/tau [Syntrophomonadaceae bacterium]|nr:DNA polymerase III subunit gamma/tau [Syntrophomonadaceae bacterium]
MTHVALYREWRPQKFSEIVGQEHVCRTLQNALGARRINHAYLFCGPRGTGKTSTARILAKAVNCAEPSGGEPCGSCTACRAISEGQSLDVLEIDAASNRGIDEIRDLREKVRFAPVQGGYRVYIIDEVHMLTSEAFNALLKTLEEPPPHVIFILATTEAHRVPATISSRCQRFDFRRIPSRAIVRQLEAVAESLGVQVAPEAMGKMVKAAEGSLRDALGLLDQCVVLAGDCIERTDVDLVLGTVAEDYLEEITDSLIERDFSRLLGLIDCILNEGKEVRRLAHDLIDYLRDLLMVSLGDCEGVLVGRSAQRLQKQSQQLGTDRLISAIRYLTAMESEIRWALQPRWLLEIALIQVAEGETSTAGEANSQIRALTQKIAELERIISEPVKKISPETASEAALKGKTIIPAEGEAGRPGEKSRVRVRPAGTRRDGELPAEGLDLDFIRARWLSFLEALRKRQVATHALVVEAEPARFESGVVTLVFRKGCEWHCQRVEEAKRQELVEEVLSQTLGARVSICCRMQEEMAPEEPPAGGPAAAGGSRRRPPKSTMRFPRNLSGFA